ncbi:MAG: orotidine-5'-phosphate decarboxylase [Alphaproteobacteria bacterium]|nr:orotidine-5'-phosphate decarboxylase [Alphaproteobacteria bacterium]
MTDTRVFCAIDTADTARATGLAGQLKGLAAAKIGLEFFMANGPEGVRQVAAAAGPIFLDLKLHDIPNTVAGAVTSLLPLKPAFLNVHAAGGPAMMQAARAAADKAGAARPKMLAVTVLTSLDAGDLKKTGQHPDTLEQVARLALLAKEQGMDGVVCGPTEIARLRQLCGPDFILMVPGIRPSWAEANDQKRVLTPRAAIEAGASYLVIGRPITGAADPAEAARRINAELAA